MSEIPFYQVLLFREQKNSLEFGPAIWAALAEVASFYNFDESRADFRRYFLAQTMPEGIEQGSGFDQESNQAVLSSREWWDPIGGWSLSAPPLDKDVLLNQVRQLLGGQASDASLLVVTDLEIEPPPGWRYIIWFGEGNGTVVSLLPTDPEFWGLKQENRLSIIKHRVRTACCSAVGEHLGFERCDNPQCFLYSSVGSVNQLDSMICLGKEHRKPTLEGLGFLPVSENPGDVQSLANLSSSVSLDNESAAIAS